MKHTWPILTIALLATTSAPRAAENPADPTTPLVTPAADTTTAAPATPVANPAAEQRRFELQEQLRSADQEYEQAKDEFAELEKQCTRLGQGLDQAERAGDNTRAQSLQAELNELNARRELAKGRFELAIKQRKVLTQRWTLLAGKAEQGNPVAAPAQQSVETGKASSAPPTSKTAPGAPPVATAVTDAKPTAAAPTMASESRPEPANAELRTARRKADQKRQAADRAATEAETTTQRVESLQQEIELERKLLDAAQGKVDNLQATLAALEAEFHRRFGEGVTAIVLQPLRRQIVEKQHELTAAQDETRRRADQLSDLQSQLSAVQLEQIAALGEADQKQGEAQAALQRVQSLENPFTAANTMNWIGRHGLALGMVLVGMVVAGWFCRILVWRFAWLMTRSDDAGSGEERNARVKVFSRFFMRGAYLLILIVGVLMMLDEMGVPIVPLWTMFSAVLAMVAMGFVAIWSVLSNALCAMILLIHQPFCIGNTIELTSVDVRGKVINFNLLFTTLRADNGDLIELPNNTFFQQPIRRTLGRKNVSLDEQLLKEQPTE